MDESEALLVLAALGVGYVVLKNSHAFGYDVPAGDIGPGGITGPARTDSHGNSLAGEIGAAACVGGGAVVGGIYGGPAGATFGAKVGGALAPACAAVAPYVAKGAVFVAKEAAAGASFIGHYTAEGARDVGKAGVAAASFAAKTITNPGTTFIKTNVAIANAVNSGTALVDRGVNALYDKSPTPVKLAIAPIVGAVKVSAKLVSVGTKVGDTGAAVASKVAGTLESGAKTAGHALSSGASTVLGWL